MKVQITDDFDLEKIADSGQCFRWEKEGIQSYRIIAGRSCLYITALDDRWFELDCTETEFDSFWRGYFDLQEDYRAIRERIEREKDPFLWKAARQEKGIRILRQDPWEMLVTFIISQNRNIPAIRRSVEMLAETCGERREDKKGRSFYAFPNPAAVASLSREALDGCRIGYRGKYVMAAARAVVEGTICLEKLYKESEEGTIYALTSLYGVGVKVASCISLFGLHHVDAFPVDVWMKRILSQEYPGGYPFERYAPYNGIYQQYMFAYYRHKAENMQRLKDMIIPAGKGNLKDVKFITHTTIQAVYPKYYPGGAVQFFTDYHNDKHIADDIAGGKVFLLHSGGAYAGTVTINGNNISRLFVLPRYQGRGYGRVLLDFAEEKIFRRHDTVIVDASFPAKKIYKKRGYVEIEYNIIKMDNGDYLCFDVMGRKRGKTR